MGKIKFVNQAVVSKRIVQQFESYDREAYEIFKYYAIEAMIYFDTVQTSIAAEEKGMFWTNHTFKAATGFFAKAFQVPGRMGLTFGNTTSYAKRLEEDFGGKYAAFPHMLERFWPMILRDLRILYGDKRET